MKRIIIILMVVLLTLTSVSSLTITPELKSEILNLQYKTEDYYPHNFVDKNGNINGMSIQVLYLILSELGIKPDEFPEIKMEPWPRACNSLLEEKNIILFGMGSNPERKALGIQFVGPYYTNQIIIVGKTSDGVRMLDSVQDAKNFKLVAIYKDIGYQKLKKAGLTEDNTTMDVFPDLFSAIRFFNRRNSDYFATTLTSVEHLLNNQTYYIAYIIATGYSSYGFSKDVNPEIIQTFQAVLNVLKKKGKVKMVTDLYMKK